MKRYYQIGEISNLYNIGTDSLRYYEKIGILKPKRSESGYRLYSIQDVWKLNVIKDLRSLNFSMEKIKDYIENRTVNHTLQLLEEEKTIVEDKIRELNQLKDNIALRIKLIEEVVSEPDIETCSMHHYKKRKILYLDEDVTKDEEIDFLIKKLNKDREDKLFIIGNNAVGATLSLNKVKQEIFDYYNTVFFLLDDTDENYDGYLDEGEYLTLTFKGNQNQNKTYLKQMFQYIEEHELDILDDPIELYKIDIDETNDVNEFVTEIQILVKRT